MSILNKKTCLDSGGNTGVGTCFFDLKDQKGDFIVPADFVLTEEQLASKETVKAALEAATIAAKALRVYPVHGFVSVENNSSDATVQTLADGTEITLNDGKYKLTHQYIEGGMCLNKALRKFNNSNGLAFFSYDASGQLIGWRDGNTLRGIPAKFYAPKMTPADFANTTVYRHSKTFDPIYLNDKFGIVEGGDFTFWETIKGISDVALYAEREAGVITAEAESGCAEVSLYDLYADELAVAGAWVARNATTGVVIPITSVVKNDGLKAWVITLTIANPNYTTGLVTLSLASPAALDALDVSKYESNVITVAIAGS